jgi:hypothetical protein
MLDFEARECVGVSMSNPARFLSRMHHELMTKDPDGQLNIQSLILTTLRSFYTPQLS